MNGKLPLLLMTSFMIQGPGLADNIVVKAIVQYIVKIILFSSLFFLGGA